MTDILIFLFGTTAILMALIAAYLVKGYIDHLNAELALIRRDLVDLREEIALIRRHP